MKIAVTGTTGFVGSALVAHLRNRSFDVRAIDRGSEFSFEGIEAVIHIAGLAHRSGRLQPTAEEFDTANHQFTRKLAARAAEADVKRFVFLSSVNVVAGNEGILSPEMPFNPLSEYGQSKARAELALREYEQIEPVILRPPLVYGPHPKGNMATLLRMASSPLPLPFASIDNRRTMISISNLVEAIEFATTTEGLAGRVFHVTDGRDISLREIIATIRAARGQPDRLFPVPPKVLDALLGILGKQKIADQLFGDLIVDGSLLNRAGWLPRHDPSQGLQAMAMAGQSY